MKPLHVGIVGFGTVGKGVWDVLRRNEEEITRRAGRPIRVSWVATRTLDRARSGTRGATDVNLTNDAAIVVEHPDVDIVCELIGGLEPARTLVLAAIANGKHVVTANKALLAQHGNEIFAAASAKGVMVAFEAAVAGGIPIIKALREGLTANRIEWIAGIINGTSNFILSEMRATGASFATVLKEAQARGYAEADPTFDVEGIDAAHKLSIMSAIAFGVPMQFDKCYAEGISTLSREDIRYAEELGYRIKLLGITRRAKNGIELRVHPTLIPHRRLIANVEGAMNAVLVMGDAVGPTLLLRRGRGRRADGERRDRGPGRRHAHAHRRPRASRAAPRVPARPDEQSAVPADGRGRDELLPAHARRGQAGRARRHHAHPRRSRHLDRRDDPEGAAGRRGAGRYHPADAPLDREQAHRRHRVHRGAADGPRQDRPHPDGTTQLMTRPN